LPESSAARNPELAVELHRSDLQPKKPESRTHASGHVSKLVDRQHRDHGAEE
jgi:hypothetical protein